MSRNANLVSPLLACTSKMDIEIGMNATLEELVVDCNFTLFNFSVPYDDTTLLDWNDLTYCLNSTLLIDSTEYMHPVRGAAKYIWYVLYVLVLLSGIFGNILVFYVIGYLKKKRNSGDIYILSLACADFFASLVVVVIMVNDLITNYSAWIFGKALCYVLPGVSQATKCASAWFLILISLNRYR